MKEKEKRKNKKLKKIDGEKGKLIKISDYEGSDLILARQITREGQEEFERIMKLAHEEFKLTGGFNVPKQSDTEAVKREIEKVKKEVLDEYKTTGGFSQDVSAYFSGRKIPEYVRILFDEGWIEL
ncbi:MAG: hypothetical protein ACOC56_02220 [Atribacterota bacterium]